MKFLLELVLGFFYFWIVAGSILWEFLIWLWALVRLYVFRYVLWYLYCWLVYIPLALVRLAVVYYAYHTLYFVQLILFYWKGVFISTKSTLWSFLYFFLRYVVVVTVLSWAFLSFDGLLHIVVSVGVYLAYSWASYSFIILLLQLFKSEWIAYSQYWSLGEYSSSYVYVLVVFIINSVICLLVLA